MLVVIWIPITETEDNLLSKTPWPNWIRIECKNEIYLTLTYSWLQFGNRVKIVAICMVLRSPLIFWRVWHRHHFLFWSKTVRSSTYILSINPNTDTFSQAICWNILSYSNRLLSGHHSSDKRPVLLLALRCKKILVEHLEEICAAVLTWKILDPDQLQIRIENRITNGS